MEKFRFKQDVKVTVWVRQSFTIEGKRSQEGGTIQDRRCHWRD